MIAPRTSYDKVNKIWYGEPMEMLYDEKLTIGEIVYDQLQQHTEHVLQFSDTEKTTLTGREILKNSISVATSLRSMGITEQDVVGVVGYNSTHMSQVVIGCLFNASAFHAVNPSLEAATISKLFDITKPKVIFCDGGLYAQLQTNTRHYAPKLLTMDEQVPGALSVMALLNTPTTEDFKPTSVAHALSHNMAILCSSGTTGTPKAVTITNTRQLFQNFRLLKEQDVLYAPSTMDWITGVMTLLISVIYGAKRIITRELFTPENYLRLVSQYKVTSSLLSASHIALLANCANTTAAKLATLRVVGYGGGPATLNSQRRMCSLMRADGVLCMMYGMTELGAIITSNLSFNAKPGSCGLLFPGNKVQIVDDHGRRLGPTEPGELWCYNNHNWQGYVANPVATSATLTEDGWIKTGDIGYFDEDNFLYIVDRKKEMLKYSSMMYYPQDIEAIIAQMPQVVEVCVFGIWNETQGDAAAALVVKKLDEDLQVSSIIEFVQNSTHEKFKHLNAGALIVDKLLYIPNGKIDRKANRDLFLKLTGKNQ